VVVTKNELVPRFYSNEKSLSNACNIAEKRGYGIKRIVKGGGNHPMLIDFDSLPEHIRVELVDPRKGRHILFLFYKFDSAALDFYTNYRFADHSHLEQKNIEQYAINASVISAVLKLKDARVFEITSKKKVVKRLWQGLCTDTALFNAALQNECNQQHSLPDNWQHFKRKIADFQQRGYKCLISGKHKNKNAKVQTDKTMQLLNDMFSTQFHKPNYKEVGEQYKGFLAGYVDIICNSTGELYNPNDFAPISSKTVANYLAKWENRITNEPKRTANRQLSMSKFKPHFSLHKPTMAGEIISIDDRQPPFIFDSANNSRPWFYNAYDIASECFTVAVHGKEKKGLIVEFYRQMVRNYTQWGVNLPIELECESSLNSTFRDTLLKDGNMFWHVRIEANNARGKYIERVYNTVRYKYEKQHEGFIPRHTAKSEANQLGTDPEKIKVVPYEYIISQTLAVMEGYNNEPHSKHPEKTRWEYFLENQSANTRPTNWRGILPYIGFKTSTSCNVGIVKLQRAEWLLGLDGKISTGEQLIDLMNIVEGNDIDVYWLDGNDGNVLKALAYIGEHFICELHPKPISNRTSYNRTAADLEARELMSKYVATIEGFGSRKRKLIEKVTVINNRPDTLNNKFSFNGLFCDADTKSTSAQTIDEPSDEVEILEEVSVENDVTPDLIDFASSFKTLLKDRF
jgi:hypothetical protein